MNKRIIILLLSVCLVCSGCIEVEYTSNVKLSLFPKKKLETLEPEIVGYDYPNHLKKIKELKRIEPVEEKPVKIIFAKFNN